MTKYDILSLKSVFYFDFQKLLKGLISTGLLLVDRLSSCFTLSLILFNVHGWPISSLCVMFNSVLAFKGSKACTL